MLGGGITFLGILTGPVGGTTCTKKKSEERIIIAAINAATPFEFNSLQI